MKMFSKIIMGSEFNEALLKDGYFQASATDAEVEDGALVSLDAPRAHDLYDDMKDLNAWNVVAYDTDKEIHGIVDYVGVDDAIGQGLNAKNNYRVSDMLAGIHPVAGENTRIRLLQVGDEFYLGNENFASAPTIGEFAKGVTGATTFTPASEIDKTVVCLKVLDERDLIVGQVNEGSKLYRCVVVNA